MSQTETSDKTDNPTEVGDTSGNVGDTSTTVHEAPRPSGVTAAKGFVAAGIHAGIKPSGAPDLALVATADGRPVPAAGVFTSNKLTAPPVIVSRSHLEATGGMAAGVILNSGNANAATGPQGRADASRMADLTADGLGCRSEEVLVCSTGLIGYTLPMPALEVGIPRVHTLRWDSGGLDAATAIMTTDSVTKEVVVRSTATNGSPFIVGGMAKGAAMLEPNMATMLAVLTTDAAADAATLKRALLAGVANSFNTLTVDGAESTNDTVLLLASGLAGPVDEATLAESVALACTDLAIQMADDAEGSTKTVFVTVAGAVSDEEAAIAARAIANCQLVKCSWYGKDPYWGRVASEAGAAGISFDQSRVSVAYGGIVNCRGGVNHEHDIRALAAYMENRRLQLTVDLGLGDGEATVVTTDLSHAYVDENMGTS